ncbi:ABC transporter substrate-binding protein [Pelagibius litoralis]|nr:ABC transporter substrate-binding protein [Pelagibius litoralis]
MASAEPREGGTLKVFSSGWRTLNPAVQSGASAGVPGSQIFAGLVEVRDNFEITPYGAESWELSDDKMSVTFKLREAKFHDGEPVTSEDVKFSLFAARDNHPFGTVMFGRIKDVETPAPDTVVFNLTEPTPGLMLSLQPLLMPILPKHIYDDGQELKTHLRNNENVIGSGPFKLVENTIGERIVLEKNEGFFIEGRPYLDRIVITAVSDQLTRLLMIENGELDYAPNVGLRYTDADRLEKKEGLIVTSRGFEALAAVAYLELNLRKEPFTDVNVRRALAHALDRELMNQIVFGGRSRVGEGPLHSNNPLFTPGAPAYEFDMEKAAAMLDEAGLTAGADGKRFGFVLDIPTWAPHMWVPFAEYIQAQYSKLGIDVELRRAPDFGTWAGRVASWEYDATVNGSFNYPDPTIGVERHLRCDNIRNVTWSNTQGYCDPEMDEILAKAAVETDFETRRALYDQVQRKAMEDVALLYLVQEYSTTVYTTKLGNPPLSPFGALAPYYDVYLED